MKKITQLLLIAAISFLVVETSQYVHKYKKKKKLIVLEAPTPRLETLPLDKIHSHHLKQTLEEIATFPNQDYSIHYVADLGHFYLDQIEDAIKDALRANVPWERFLALKMKEKIPLGSTVIDIGAHIGTHTLTFSQAVGPWGRVIAFEPQPKIFRELFLNMTLNGASNVDFYHAAVGDHLGEIELSPFTPQNEGGTGLHGGTGKFAELLTIDSLHLDNVSLIKIDVEGMEDSVLDGARETILKNRPVIFIEICGGFDLLKASPDVLQLIQKTVAKLHELHYEVIHLGLHEYMALPQAKT